MAQALFQLSSIRFKRESDSNVILSIMASSKQNALRLSTEQGMQIDFKKQALKQKASIRVTLDIKGKTTIAIICRPEFGYERKGHRPAEDHNSATIR
jgi:hypothetical protein